MEEKEGIPYIVLESARPFKEDGEGGFFAEVGEQDGTKLLMECDSEEEAVALSTAAMNSREFHMASEGLEHGEIGRVVRGVALSGGDRLDVVRFVLALRAAILDTAGTLWGDASSLALGIHVEAKKRSNRCWKSIRPSDQDLFGRCVMRLGEISKITEMVDREDSTSSVDEIIRNIHNVVGIDPSSAVWDVVDVMSVVLFRIP